MGYWWDKGTLVDQYLMGSLMRMTMKHGGCWTWWSWHMIYHKRFCPYKLGVHNINYQKYGMNRLVRDALFFMVYTYWWCRDEDCVEFALYIIRIMCCACSKALSLSLSLSLFFPRGQLFIDHNLGLIYFSITKIPRNVMRFMRFQICFYLCYILWQFLVFLWLENVLALNYDWNVLSLEKK